MAGSKGNTKTPDRRTDPARAPTRSPRGDGRKALFLIAFLSAAHFTLALASVRDKSNTYDEIAHLTRGYSYRMTDDFRLGPPHPPLAHYWASLPGSLSQIKFPTTNQNAWRTSDMWTVGRQFFYYKNQGNDAIIDSLLFKGRAMIALWSVAIGLVVYVWAKRLFGPTGGLISLAVFAFSPTMLAHGRLVTTDCAVTLFFMCSLASIWWMLHKVSPASVLLSAGSLACLFLSKMSAPLIIPVGAAMLIVRLIVGRPLVLAFGRRSREIRRRLPQLGCLVAVMCFWIAAVWASIWAAYGFRYEAMAHATPGVDRFYTAGTLSGDRDIWEYELRGLDHLAPTISWLREHHVFPEAYIYSAVSSAQTARGRNAFLCGERSIHGYTAFFPFTFLVKTPLPLFALLIAAACVPFLRRQPATAAVQDEAHSASALHFLYDVSPLLIFFVAYWEVSLRSHLNIGHRHILPTYPVLFILCGATARYMRSSARPLRWAVPATVALLACATLWRFPDYLAYFNSFAGWPDHAYRYLVDSSLDWGQDLPGLKQYLDKRRADGDTKPAYISYFGSGGTLAIEHFGIDATPIPPSLSKDGTGFYDFAPGIYAISATNLQQVYNGLESNHWTAEMEDQYRKWQPTFDAFCQSADTPQARAQWTENAQFKASFRQYQRLMSARLCAYLRRQKPTATVHHTILIYDLDQKMLDEALRGEFQIAPDRDDTVQPRR